MFQFEWQHGLQLPTDYLMPGLPFGGNWSTELESQPNAVEEGLWKGIGISSVAVSGGS